MQIGLYHFRVRLSNLPLFNVLYRHLCAEVLPYRFRTQHTLHPRNEGIYIQPINIHNGSLHE